MFFYRFLRTHTKEYHASEIDGPIVFYTPDECCLARDFELNAPVKEKIESGQNVQLLFGMECLDDAVHVLHCFDCYKRVLARFKLSFLDTDYSIHLDEQVNQCVGSKYIMSDFNGEKISIPNEFVEVLSLSGWKAKSEARNVLIDINDLENKYYEQLITNS